MTAPQVTDPRMIPRQIRSTDVLDVARLLAPPVVGPGRPRTAALRRAVSTAYYALFHELVAQATVELCGEGASTAPERRTAARWFAHTDIRALAEAVNGANSGGAARAVAPVLGSPHQDLIFIARTFATLQKERYRADYDHEYAINRRDTLVLVDRAQDAIEAAQRLADCDDQSYRRFLKLMVGAVKIARTRSL